MTSLSPGPGGNSICGNCGTVAAAGAQFCSACGAAVVQEAYPPPTDPLPAASATWGWVLGGAFIAIAVLASFLIVTRGDEQASGPSQQSASPGDLLAGPTVQVRTGATAVAPTPTPAPEIARDPTPIAYVIQPGRPEARFGPMDETTAASVRDSLRNGGFDLTGAEVYVFAIVGTPGEKLLVIDADAVKAKKLLDAVFAVSDAETRRFAGIIANNPAVSRARVAQLAINLNGTDSVGPYTLTATLATDTLQALARGDKFSDKQTKELMLLQVKRGGH